MLQPIDDEDRQNRQVKINAMECIKHQQSTHWRYLKSTRACAEAGHTRAKLSSGCQNWHSARIECGAARTHRAKGTKVRSCTDPMDEQDK
eukprot:13644181-Alexandrium_andersonii.AAC.1